MESTRGNAGLYIIIFIAVLIVGLVVWFIMGKNRIITAVPENGEEGERVILVTPQATPTSEFDEATDSAEPTVEEEEELTIAPTEEEEEEPTEAPEPTEKESETDEDPTPTETE